MSETLVPPALENVLMVYVGRRQGKDGKISYVWVELLPESADPIADTTNGRWYSKPLARCSPGTVYEFKGQHQANGQLTVYSDKTGDRAPVYKRIFQDEDVRHSWQVLDQQVELRQRREREAKKQQKRGNVTAQLEPWRLAYQNANSAAARAEILANLIEYVTKYKP